MSQADRNSSYVTSGSFHRSPAAQAAGSNIWPPALSPLVKRTERPHTAQALCLAGLCGISAKLLMSKGRYERLMASASTNVVNVSTNPAWSLVASGFVFPSWPNVGHLAAAIAAAYVIEKGPGGSSTHAATVLAAGHVGVSWAIAAVQKSLISAGRLDTSVATIPDDVGSSYAAYATVTAATGVLARRYGAGWLGQAMAMSVVASPALVRMCQTKTQTNIGHFAAAAAGGLCVLVSQKLAATKPGTGQPAGCN